MFIKNNMFPGRSIGFPSLRFKRYTASSVFLGLRSQKATNCNVFVGPRSECDANCHAFLSEFSSRPQIGAPVNGIPDCRLPASRLFRVVCGKGVMLRSAYDIVRVYLKGRRTSTSDSLGDFVGTSHIDIIIIMIWVRRGSGGRTWFGWRMTGSALPRAMDVVFP